MDETYIPCLELKIRCLEYAYPARTFAPLAYTGGKIVPEPAAPSPEESFKAAHANLFAIEGFLGWRFVGEEACLYFERSEPPREELAAGMKYVELPTSLLGALQDVTPHLTINAGDGEDAYGLSQQ